MNTNFMAVHVFLYKNFGPLDYTGANDKERCFDVLLLQFGN